MKTAWVLTTMCVLSLASGGAAQERPSARTGSSGDELAVAEIQRLLDAYALVQAQEALELTDAQYGPFIARLRKLQAVRREGQQQRAELMEGLTRLTTQEPPADEALVGERLRSLREHDARASAAVRRAYEAIDALLGVVQQARFRVFEDRMEQRRLQMLMRAREPGPPGGADRPR